MSDAPSAWRENRDPGWFRDIGYVLQNALSQHRYDLRSKGSRPDDPGWHECTCGWEGYWSSFEPHVADHLRACVIPAQRGTAVSEHSAEIDAPCGYYDEPGQDCFTAGMAVIVAEGLCGPCAVRLIDGRVTPPEVAAPSPCEHGRRYCPECHADDFL